MFISISYQLRMCFCTIKIIIKWPYQPKHSPSEALIPHSIQPIAVLRGSRTSLPGDRKTGSKDK